MHPGLEVKGLINDLMCDYIVLMSVITIYSYYICKI